jgi:catechol 1,2-dioxygenase
MQRRKFIQNSGVFALGVGVFGKIQWNGNRFIGDTPTTTDILGPFYRPGAPLRININPPGFSGEVLHLTGTVFKEDGKTPFKNCLIEIWQCDLNLEYDNISDEYKHRGAQKTGADGKYHFITTQPQAYPIRPGSSILRPAHIHMRISGEGQQDLITQVYFKGDRHLADDPCSSSPEAVNRIMTVVKNKQDEQQISFDIIMKKEFKPDKAVFEKICGVYTMNDNSMMEFYRDGDLLFMKWNGQIREGLWYKGINEFSGGIDNRTAKFDLQPDGKVKVAVRFITAVKKGSKEYKESNLEGIKTFKYKAGEY